MPYFLNLGVAKNNPSIDCMEYLINFNLLEIKLMQCIKSRMKKLNFCNKYIAIVIGVLLSLVAPPFLCKRRGMEHPSGTHVYGSVW